MAYSWFKPSKMAQNLDCGSSDLLNGPIEADIL